MGCLIFMLFQIRMLTYGLAWAHAEDDFETIQYTFLPSKGLMGLHGGKEGVIMDYLVVFVAMSTDS